MAVLAILDDELTVRGYTPDRFQPVADDWRLLSIADRIPLGSVVTLDAQGAYDSHVAPSAAVVWTTTTLKAAARSHLRDRMDEMRFIWGPEGQRWRNCRLWLLSMAAVLAGIAAVIDDDTHAEHANWDIDDLVDAFNAVKALAPERIPQGRMAVIGPALGLTPPYDYRAIRFWYFGHTIAGWQGYFGDVNVDGTLVNNQRAHFQWRRDDATPSFAEDAAAGYSWDGGTTPGTLAITFNAQAGDIEAILA